jgi:4a-hydroxytetrahydrobiopterin dehydratase
MSQLKEKKCHACEGSEPPLDHASCEKLLKEIPGWVLGKDTKHIVRSFSFKSFYPTMSFVNAVAYIAQQEGHHPDMAIGYNSCTITFTTHAIGGLSENDFICAAKINAMI